MKLAHLTIGFASIFLFHGCGEEDATVISGSKGETEDVQGLGVDPRLETWCPGTVRVEAVVYDSQEGKNKGARSRMALVQDGKKHPFIVDSASKDLTSTQLTRLVDIIVGDYKRLPGAGCYIPHHGFIFYNANDEIVAHLEVCLLCGAGGGFPNEGIAKRLSFEGPNEGLKPFLNSLGLPVFEELTEWHEYFASKK